jgi:hypothetical protein
MWIIFFIWGKLSGIMWLAMSDYLPSKGISFFGVVIGVSRYI